LPQPEKSRKLRQAVKARDGETAQALISPGAVVSQGTKAYTPKRVIGKPDKDISFVD
jgi:hypothetical protein